MPITSGRPAVSYRVRGSGEPLLVINGFGLPADMIETLVDAGEDRLTWITYDHAGVGGSPRAGAVPWTVPALADLAGTVLDELELGSAHVAGISLGGAAALELALRAPGRVRTLHLLGTTAGGPLRRHTDPVALAGLAVRVTAGSLRRRRLWFAPALYSDEHLRRRVAAPRVATPPPALSALAGQSVAATLHDRVRRLHQVSAPTLVLHGGGDALLPVGNAHDLVAGIADGELHVIEGCGHAFVLERPDEVAALIAGFIQRRGTRGPDIPLRADQDHPGVDCPAPDA